MMQARRSEAPDAELRRRRRSDTIGLPPLLQPAIGSSSGRAAWVLQISSLACRSRLAPFSSKRDARRGAGVHDHRLCLLISGDFHAPPNLALGHGPLGRRELRSTRLLPENPNPFDNDSPTRLAAMRIVEDNELNDGADAKQALAVPAGYTCLGQFIDHDLSLETTSSFATPGSQASKIRSVALDLDCL